jgi:peptidoglycan/LPS O-acetylase OafA/YrhL
LWALFIIAICVEIPSTQADPLRRALGHPMLSSIGGYSFAVYLLQWAWFYYFEDLQCTSSANTGLSATSLIAFMTMLWLSAGAALAR